MEDRRKIWSSFHCWWSEYPEWIFCGSLMRQHSTQRKFEIFLDATEGETQTCFYFLISKSFYTISPNMTMFLVSPLLLFFDSVYYSVHSNKSNWEQSSPKQHLNLTSVHSVLGNFFPPLCSLNSCYLMEMTMTHPKHRL